MSALCGACRARLWLVAVLRAKRAFGEFALFPLQSASSFAHFEQGNGAFPFCRQMPPRYETVRVTVDDATIAKGDV
jgi:hypothetical protein